MRKLLSLLIFFFVFASGIAFAEVNLIFKYDDSSMTASVKKLQAKGTTEVVIPSETELSGKVYRVTEIEKLAFDERKNLVSVKIPNSVTRIEENAFAYCKSLESVNIPDSLTKIDEDAFVSCTSLKSVRVPRGCGIGEDAFPPTCEIIRY